MGEVTEIEARCVQFVRDCASGEWRSSKYRTITESIEKRAQELVALLPKPIDPDLLIAREMAIDLLTRTVVANGNPAGNATIQLIAKAAGDENSYVVTCLAAIKKGRALATQATGHE